MNRKGRGRSRQIAVSFCLWDGNFGICIVVGSKDLSLLQKAQTGSETKPAFCSFGTLYLPGVKLSECDAEHSPLSGIEVKISRADPLIILFIHTKIYIQGDSGGICTTLGCDSMSDSKQKSSYEHVYDFERLRSYDRLKLGIEGNDYCQ